MVRAGIKKYDNYFRLKRPSTPNEVSDGLSPAKRVATGAVWRAVAGCV